jgi:sulfatase maturation enzyme AslB (radical SAM superfamily)
MNLNFLIHSERKKQEYLNRITSVAFKKTVSDIVSRFNEKSIENKNDLTGICIEITSKCDKKCPTCYYQKGGEKDIDGALLDSLIEYTNRHLFEVNLLGGEPLLHKNIINIFMNLSIIVYFVTNASKFDEKLAVDIAGKYQNVIPVFSLDGFENQNDAIRGTGSFFQTVRAINIAKGYNIPFKMLSTVTEQNIDEILGKEYLGFVEYLEPLNLGIYKYRSMADDNFSLSEKNLKKLEDNLYRIEDDAVFPVSHEEPRLIDGTLRYKLCRGLPTIGINGEIKVCPSINTGIRLTKYDSEILHKILSDWYKTVGSASNGCPIFYAREKIECFLSRHSLAGSFKLSE